jgi:hypothetical protein
VAGYRARAKELKARHKEIKAEAFAGRQGRPAFLREAAPGEF